MKKRDTAVLSVYAPKNSLHGSGASGVGSYTKNLLTNMDKKTRAGIVVLADFSEKSPQEVYEEDGMLIDRCWQKKGLSAWIKQIKTTLKKYPNVKTIHIQHEFNMFGGLFTIPMFLILLFLLRKYKVIITYHGVVDTKIIDKEYGKINSLPAYFPPLFLRFAFRFFYGVSRWQINTAIVHEEYFKKVLMRYGYKDSQVQAIPHGIEDISLPISKEEARKQLGIPQDKKVLLYFGFLAGYKGVDLLLDGFEKLDPEKHHLILAGGTPKRTLQDPVFRAWYEGVDKRSTKMPGVLRLGGFVEDELIPVLYAAADVLMIPYLYMLAASGPMALSISYHLPFLVSEVFSPVIQDPEMRFQKTPKALAQRIESLDQDLPYIQKVVDKMRKERLWEHISKKTALLYK